MTDALISEEDPITAMLREAAMRPFRPGERREQMISFMMGTLGDDSTISREEVVAHLERHEREMGIVYDPA